MEMGRIAASNGTFGLDPLAPFRQEVIS
jgi:hypothetical protein